MLNALDYFYLGSQLRSTVQFVVRVSVLTVMRLLNVVLMSISSPSLKNSRKKKSVMMVAIHKLQDSLRQTLAFSDEDNKLDGPRYLNEDQVKEIQPHRRLTLVHN